LSAEAFFINSKGIYIKIIRQELNLRPLSTFERFFWLANQVAPTHFSVSAQIAGHTEIEDWYAALSSLQQRHPLLAASIELDENGTPYFRKKMETPIPLRVVRDTSLVQFETEVSGEIATPFDSAKDPLARAVLLHGEDQSIIILVVHHSIADAISLAYAIRDLLRALSGETLEPLGVPPSHEEMLGILDKTLRAEHDRGKTTSASSAALVKPKPLELVPYVKSSRLSAQLSGRLRKRAREEGASVTAAIASALAFSFKKHGDRYQDNLRLAVPISTRKALNLGEQCAVFTDNTIVDLNTAESPSFWQLARLVKDHLVLAQSLDRITASRRDFSHAFAEINTPAALEELTSGPYNPDVIQSNLGELPLETRYGHLTLEAVWGPALLFGSPDLHLLGVASLNGSMSFLYSSYAPTPELLDSLEKILAESCQM
jgi:hypothetical protein